MQAKVAIVELQRGAGLLISLGSRHLLLPRCELAWRRSEAMRLGGKAYLKNEPFMMHSTSSSVHVWDWRRFLPRRKQPAHASPPRFVEIHYLKHATPVDYTNTISACASVHRLLGSLGVVTYSAAAIGELLTQSMAYTAIDCVRFAKLSALSPTDAQNVAAVPLLAVLQKLVPEACRQELITKVEQGGWATFVRFKSVTEMVRSISQK